MKQSRPDVLVLSQTMAMGGDADKLEKTVSRCSGFLNRARCMEIKMTRILITEPGRFILRQGDEPSVGIEYALEDVTEGTGAQNRLFHPLIMEWWSSGCHSSRARSFDEFRDEIKRDLGAGFERFVYADVDDSGVVSLKQVETYDEVPEYIRKSPRRNDLVRGRLKSWADYTMKERRLTIDRVIASMHQSGCNSKRFHEILQSLEEKQR